MMLCAVGRAIAEGLTALETEKVDLSHRLDDLRDLASVAGGTEHDEYLSREPVLLAHLQDFELEMMSAMQRLNQVNERIVDLQFVWTAFHSRFSKLNSSSDRER